MLKFKKTKYITSGITTNSRMADFPKDVWMKCDSCSQMILKEDVVDNHYVCYKCGKYFRLRAKTRIKFIADEGSFVSWDDDLKSTDPLNFPGYEEKMEALKSKLKISDAVLTGKCKIGGKETVICIMDGRFMMGSMGYVVGERITRAVEQATQQKLPVVIFSCSGGARMQEGMVSLMQMAKTSMALKEHSKAGLFYLSVLTDPTTGGVTASFAMLGDIILAEPGALVGFAGPRVIEQTIRQKLPEGFQRSEFLLEQGLIDGIITRENMVDEIANLLEIHSSKPKLNDIVKPLDEIKSNVKVKAEKCTTWEKVEIARSKERPTALDYIEDVFDDFYELHGDRRAYDDTAIIGGIGHFCGRAVTIIAQQKGRNTKDNIYRNFAMPRPEGYVKALRLMKQAERFNRPIICFIDTPGAYCGMDAEEHGQGQAIAKNLFEMSALGVPILSIVIGEGGSGGALALGVGNEVWMMENATYSVLSPEGFASILWKDASRASEAASVMKMTASDLKELKIIDDIIEETSPACEENLRIICQEMKSKIHTFLKKRDNKSAQEIISERQKRFRAF